MGLYWNHVQLSFSPPGKPTDNAYVESFNARFRLECLNGQWFLSLEDACENEVFSASVLAVLLIELLNQRLLRKCTLYQSI